MDYLTPELFINGALYSLVGFLISIWAVYRWPWNFGEQKRDSYDKGSIDYNKFTYKVYIRTCIAAIVLWPLVFIALVFQTFFGDMFRPLYAWVLKKAFGES